MDSIELCMLAPEFFPVWGGTGSYILELIKYLPRDVNIHVVTLERQIPEMSEATPQNYDVSSIIERPLKTHTISKSSETFFYNLPFQLACLRTVPSLQDEYKFDLVHTHLCHMPDLFLQLFRKISTPTVLTVHGTIKMLRDHALIARSLFKDLEWGERYTLLFFPFIELLEKRYVKHITRFIAVSKVTRELIMKYLNVEPERISLVYNGVDTELFQPPEKREVNAKFSDPTIVFIGRMVSKKGIHLLIRAMPKVLQAFPKTKFLFIGGGNVPLFKGILRELQIPKANFSFPGHVGYFERSEILRKATVFVNPSFFENCSLSILEAMSCGTAVIACNVGGNPELIETGKNGQLIPPFDDKELANSIISLLKDENLNRKIGNEARRTVETSFSSEKCAEETYDVYKSVLEEA